MRQTKRRFFQTAQATGERSGYPSGQEMVVSPRLNSAVVWTFLAGDQTQEPSILPAPLTPSMPTLLALFGTSR